MSTRKTSKQTQTRTKAKRTPRAKPKPPLVRGEAVVQKVLEAALEELATVGYRGFRIEEVAARAEVNKTTIYRRWPAKVDLVRETLDVLSRKRTALATTGSLRADLFALGKTFMEHACNPLGKGLFRMLAAEAADPEVRDLVASLRERNHVVPMAMIASAEARGELAPGIDHMVIISALIGALHHRVFLMDETLDEAFLTALIDLLLLGALRPSR